MKSKWLPVLTILWSLALLGPVHAANRSSIKAIPECKYCGMYLDRYAYSRVILRHENGIVVGTCSINCAAVDAIKDLDNPPGIVWVGDYKTKQLVDAEKAYWVIGGDRPGVMTQRAKWAFTKRSDAMAFIKKHGGQLTTFDEIMKASYEDIYEDMKPLKADMHPE